MGLRAMWAGIISIFAAVVIDEFGVVRLGAGGCFCRFFVLIFFPLSYSRAGSGACGSWGALQFP